MNYYRTSFESFDHVSVAQLERGRFPVVGRTLEWFFSALKEAVKLGCQHVPVFGLLRTVFSCGDQLVAQQILL